MLFPGARQPNKRSHERSYKSHEHSYKSHEHPHKRTVVATSAHFPPHCDSVPQNPVTHRAFAKTRHTKLHCLLHPLKTGLLICSQSKLRLQSTYLCFGFHDAFFSVGAHALRFGTAYQRTWTNDSTGKQPTLQGIEHATRCFIQHAVYQKQKSFQNARIIRALKTPHRKKAGARPLTTQGPM